MKILIVDDERQIVKTLALALNNGAIPVGYALNMDMGMADGAAAPPAELMLVPAGARVEGRDGRGWNNPDPQGIVDFFKGNGVDIPMDVEHATQLKAPNGDAAPAMAWGTGLEVKSDGSVWGKFDWNAPGSDLVMNRQYRYYSPAYIYDRQTMNIVGIKSVGLTNTPNLDVPALNQQQEKGVTMNLAAILAVLGMAPTATFDEAINHITKLKGDLNVALNAANSPSLDKFVPKADYDVAVNRANDSEAKLKLQADAALETAINTEIAAALTAGKITPATKEYHIAQCKQEGGLERFKAFATAAPTVADKSNLDGKKPGDQETALNAEEQRIAGMFGNSAEDIAKYGK
jgi:phage I-like protein